MEGHLLDRGLYEPLVMFFSLTNSPATFQTMMDDILIFMETREEHRKITRHMRELLEKHKLYLRSDKCKFEETTIEYLGVIISHNSVVMDPVKIAGVTEWPALTNKKEVQSFLGFTNFYRQFIRDFSPHARPLFDLTRNDSHWHWGEAECAAFARLKGSVTSAPVLISPDPPKPVRGTPYASDSCPSSASASDSRLSSASAPATSSLFRNAFGCMTSYATRSRPASLPTRLPLMTR